MTVMKAAKFLLFAVVLGVISACKFSVIVVEGGEVQSGSSGTCTEGTICIGEEDDTNFGESFTAIPNPGWHFARWNEGLGFLCGGSTDRTCVVSSEGFEENAVLEAIIASDLMFYMMPIFRPGLGTLLKIDGREWAQADLFSDVSWDDINAVCPGGVCGSGTLNGYDMTGWTWASIADVKALFNAYIGDDVLDSETHRYDDATVTIQASERFYADGWFPTWDGANLGALITEWNVHLRDMTPMLGDENETAFAQITVARARDGDPPPIVLAWFSIGSPDEEASPTIGAAFYR